MGNLTLAALHDLTLALGKDFTKDLLIKLPDAPESINTLHGSDLIIP